MPQDVGSFQLQIQAVDNRVAFSEIVTVPFNIGRVWYLDPKTAIPFWGSIMLLIGFSTVTYINYRKKSLEAEELREAEIERQQAEMEEAREFQQAMLPSEMPVTDDYEMGFKRLPLRSEEIFSILCKKKMEDGSQYVVMQLDTV